jgi:hypothetical protein
LGLDDLREKEQEGYVNDSVILSGSIFVIIHNYFAFATHQDLHRLAPTKQYAGFNESQRLSCWPGDSRLVNTARGAQVVHDAAAFEVAKREWNKGCDQMTPALKSLGEIPADCEHLAVVETREQAPLAVLTKSIAVLPALDQLMIKSD